jgi:hypothetical protein
VKDGQYLLNLQITSFVSDASPSRVLLFQLRITNYELRMTNYAEAEDLKN